MTDEAEKIRDLFIEQGHCTSGELGITTREELEIARQNGTAKLKASRLSLTEILYELNTAQKLLDSPLPIIKESLVFDHRVELFFYLRLLAIEYRRIEAATYSNEADRKNEYLKICDKVKEINQRLGLANNTFESMWVLPDRTAEEGTQINDLNMPVKNDGVLIIKAKKKDSADKRESQLYILIWRVHQVLNQQKKPTAQVVWREIQKNHKIYDTDKIIQEVDGEQILWCSGYGKEQKLQRSSFDKTLSNIRKNPPI